MRRKASRSLCREIPEFFHTAFSAKERNPSPPGDRFLLDVSLIYLMESLPVKKGRLKTKRQREIRKGPTGRYCFWTCCFCSSGSGCSADCSGSSAPDSGFASAGTDCSAADSGSDSDFSADSSPSKSSFLTVLRAVAGPEIVSAFAPRLYRNP